MGRLGKRGSASIGHISKGEREILNTLKKQFYKYSKVTFFRETRLNDCRGVTNKPLPFDFSIYINGELMALIEFQGVQHYIPAFGTDDWEKLKSTDRIKEEYCKKKEIPFLAVPYYKFDDMEIIVIRFLRDNGILRKARDTKK